MQVFQRSNGYAIPECERVDAAVQVVGRAVATSYGGTRTMETEWEGIRLSLDVSIFSVGSFLFKQI